jgi:hypothetical protein
MEAGFATDAKPHFLSYPAMSHDANQAVDGNAVLYAGTYALISFKLYGVYGAAVTHEKDLYEAVKVDQGVIGRFGKPKDAQTHDDYIGLATLSGLTENKQAAIDMFVHGKLNHWSFVNVAYNFTDLFNAQFWRLPGVVQHIKLCAGKAWNWLDIVLFALSVIFNAFTPKDSTSGKILVWHSIVMYECLGDSNWLSDFAVRFWKHQILKMYPNAMGDIFGIYFGPDHVFTKWTKGII